MPRADLVIDAYVRMVHQRVPVVRNACRGPPFVACEGVRERTAGSSAIGPEHCPLCSPTSLAAMSFSSVAPTPATWALARASVALCLSAAILAVAAAAAAPQNIGGNSAVDGGAAAVCNFTISNATCYNGGTYAHRDTETAAGCCAACSADSQCTFFTFNTVDRQAGKACRLKHGTPGQPSGSLNCTSGTNLPPPPPPPPPHPPIPPPSPPNPNAPRPHIGGYGG